MKERAWSFLMYALVVYFMVAIIGKFAPQDDTDPADGRSGLGLYIDARTSCHYLSGGPFGGITPRLDRNGKHICGISP